MIYYEFAVLLEGETEVRLCSVFADNILQAKGRLNQEVQLHFPGRKYVMKSWRSI